MPRAAALSLLTFALALWLRWRALPVAVVLGDSMGPWWRAMGDPLRAHAPPYGAGLNLPYALILSGAGSLWQAVSALLALHALVAPLAVLGVLRLRPGAWTAALLAGLAAAVDPGLIDTAISGCEGYLASLWIGAALLAILSDRPVLAGLALGLAVHNHPLALAALPLLLRLSPEGALGAGALALLLSADQLLRFADAPPGLPGEPVAAWGALLAYAHQGGPLAWIVFIGLFAGLLDARSRGVALLTLLSLGLLLGAGGALGYLRDHHLRLLTLPALVGLASLRGGWPLLGLLLLRLPADPLERPAAARRPGTLGLLHALSDALPPAERRIIDGAWLSGVPAAEPGALLLDQRLRGVPAEALDVGGPVTLLISGERAALSALPELGKTLHQGDRHRLVELSEAELRSAGSILCEAHRGGALDGWGALHPDRDPGEIGRWWSCP
jgi:hypothetical protein